MVMYRVFIDINGRHDAIHVNSTYWNGASLTFFEQSRRLGRTSERIPEEVTRLIDYCSDGI